MMKQIRKISLCILMVIMCMGMIPAICTKAAETKIPDKIRVFINDQEGGGGIASITWNSNDVLERVEHVKTDSKNLSAGINYFEADSEKKLNEQMLSIYAKKEGTYQISFDIVKNGKVVSKHKIKVYAYPMPVSVKLGTLKAGLLVGDKGKLDVKIAKGNKIKKIEVSVYKEKKTENAILYRISNQTVKNGSTVTYGKYSRGEIYYWQTQNSDKYSLSSNFTEIYAPTRINVTYKDQYTKQDETCSVEYLKIIGL